MIVSVFQPARPYADLADLTGKQILTRGWVTDADGNEEYEVQFAVNLSAAETEQIERRLATGSSVEEQLQARAWQATQNLLDYEAQATPTNAQTVAVVKLLCKVARALIRLQLRQLDTVGDPASTATVTSTAAAAQASKGK